MQVIYFQGKRELYDKDDPRLWERMCDPRTYVVPCWLHESEAGHVVTCEYCGVAIDVERNTCAQCGAATVLRS